ncbi:alanine racemase [Paludifilum halophilum]|uniref:Alanine racemase N-terminal domain-containing protein n=1 Tax=Paludifilum halophilum TaxID=1642702 RepID=A0A235B7K3_9BACL|nr:alanine racemase [Paludifilum halophilum]OYD08293.1 hypothetical protein CHM34_05420 [Paludifilum halophilum]
MSLTLYLNRREWLDHIRNTEERFPDYVPVIKGNGYGFGNEFLADAAIRSGKRTVAVGTVEEARELEGVYSFEEMLILTPVLAAPEYADMAESRVYTVGNLAQLKRLVEGFDSLCRRQSSIWNNGGEPFHLRILIKCESQMKRYGFEPEELSKVQTLIDDWNRSDSLRLEIAGYSIHFPTEGLSVTAKEESIHAWVQQIKKVGLPCNRMYVSHISSDLYGKLRKEYPSIRFHMRLGTDLWLHDKSFFSLRTTVLDVKDVVKGERFGYKQNRAKKSGRLVIVAGGTANGVALDAPTAVKGWKDRAKLTVFWLLQLTNRHLSPFTYQGKRLWFAEPPHMQTSVLFFPKGAKTPQPGEELKVQLRMTTAHFDRCVELGSDQEKEEEAADYEAAALLPNQEEKGKTLDVTS